MWNSLRLPKYFTEAVIEDNCKWCRKLNIQKDTICPSFIGKFVQASYIGKIDWISPPSRSISAQEDLPYSLNSHHEKQLLLRTSNNCKIIGSLTGAYWSNDLQRNSHHHLKGLCESCFVLTHSQLTYIHICIYTYLYTYTMYIMYIIHIYSCMRFDC